MENIVKAIENLNKIKPNNKRSLENTDYNVLDHYKFPAKVSAPPTGGVKNPFKEYRKKVRELTELVAHLIPGIHLRGFRGYHIDHKISIWYGFRNNFLPEQIAALSNLRMLFHKDNMLKGIKSDFS